MFFASAGVYEPCGIFTIKHFILLTVTIISILVALKYTYTINKNNTYKIIKSCTILLLIFELIIITFKIITGGIEHINNWVPLYYCSLLLYSGILSSFCKGKLKRMGDVFLATGGIVGGATFILFPFTSLPTYPMFHLVSIHSFIFHGIMVYLGILINATNYIKLENKDIVYYFNLVCIICIIAYIINGHFNSNLMFISQNFPGMPLEIVYNLTGKFYTTFMILSQATLPFYFILGIMKIINRKNKPND